MRAGHVLAALAERLPRDAILIEETPSSRPELHARVPATAPLGFVSAMGMLGFALPAAIGLRMASPDRPVLAVVGDGSSLYQITALWSAARYGPACSSSCSSTAATRSWTGSRSATAPTARGRASTRSTSARWRAGRAARACASRSHAELLERLDALLPGARRPHRAAAARGRRRARRDVRPLIRLRPRASRCSSPRARRGCSGRRRTAWPRRGPGGARRRGRTATRARRCRSSR